MTGEVKRAALILSSPSFDGVEAAQCSCTLDGIAGVVFLMLAVSILAIALTLSVGLFFSFFDRGPFKFLG